MRFVIRKNKDGFYWWRAVSDGNNKILAASELMHNKQDCIDAIDLVKDQAKDADVHDLSNEVSVRGSV